MPTSPSVVKISPQHDGIVNKYLDMSSHNRIELIEQQICFVWGICNTAFDTGKAVYKDGRYLSSNYVRENALFDGGLIDFN